MKFISIIIILAFLTVSLVGFTAMSHGSMGCDSLLSGVTGADCPETMISMAIHHISAYTSFLDATVSYATQTFLSALILIIMLAFLLWQSYVFDRQRILVTYYLQICERIPLPSSQKTHHWLSLLENSPTSA